jgi:RNA polymerase sigma-70 factor, ECF subfamily
MNTTYGHDRSEHDLLKAVAAGNLASFERLYELYASRVLHYVRTLVHEQAIAEEVLGDVMFAIWRGAGTFTGTARVSTWIFGIARHKAIDAVRRVGRQRTEVDLDSIVNLPASNDSPLDDTERHQVAALTNRALARLSRDHQEILRLVFFEELPYEEIALLLSIPTNTVKTRVYYAKQHLKHALEWLASKEPTR